MFITGVFYKGHPQLHKCKKLWKVSVFGIVLERSGFYKTVWAFWELCVYIWIHRDSKTKNWSGNSWFRLGANRERLCKILIEIGQLEVRPSLNLFLSIFKTFFLKWLQLFSLNLGNYAVLLLLFETFLWKFNKGYLGNGVVKLFSI